MKITEILVESQQLDEGPFGQAVGKFAGGVAKGVGAVAGGVAGLGKAFGKGYQSGKATVAGDPDPNAAPAGGADPEAPTKAAGGPETQPSATDINKDGPAGTAQAKPLQGQAKVAADKTAAATADQDPSAAGQTMYAQVKANIDKLDKKGKQRILQLLQKSMAAPTADGTTTKDQAGGTTTKDQAGAGAMGAMANQLGAAGGKPANTMANTPVSATNTAKPGNPNAAPAPAEPTAPAPAPAEPTAPAPAADTTAAPAADTTAAPAPVKTRTGGRVKGQLSQDPRAVKRREANAAKTKQQAQTPDQATIDAERDKIMGVTSDSIVRRQPMMAEGFSLFRKRT
jgi:hypothetical protein